VTVNNAGPSVATGVRVTDLLPSGVLFSSAAPSQGSYQASTGIWTVGSIPVGGSATLPIVARVRRTGNYTNVAQVSAANQVDLDSTPGNNVATEDDQDVVTIDPPRIDLSVVGTIDKDNPLLGDDVVIRFTVTNAGPDKATGVQLRGAIIDGLSLNFAAPSLGLYDPMTGIWTLGELDVGQSETIDFNVRITQPGIKQQPLEVFAADQGDLDSEPANGNIAEDDLDLVTVRLPRALTKRLLLAR
jgi:uncharacterized repeat protein (TIGR01451 family)